VRPAAVALAFAIAWVAPARPATAQVRQDDPTAQSLEQQVERELSSIGAAPSRYDLQLQLRPVATRWLVSLVGADGAVVASTRTEALPADREAAVAILTQIVADLEVVAIEARQRAKVPESAPPAPAPPAPATPARPDGDEQDPAKAERAFRLAALRFAARYDVDAVNGKVIVNRAWVVFLGDPGSPLEPSEFYRKVGRDDLAQSYTRRRRLKIASYVLGGIALAATFAMWALSVRGADIDRPDEQPDLLWPMLLAGGVSAAGIVGGIYLERNPHPIDELAARELADRYNQRLRWVLGLPPLARRTPDRDIALTPFFAGRVGGLVLRARF
jgi:hypothetical protein